MSDQMEIVDLRIAGGRCSGRVLGAGQAPPELRLDAGDISQPVPPLRAEGAQVWVFHVTLPIELLSEGVSAVTLVDVQSGAALAQFSLSVGEALADDLRGEVAMLRAELDLLKAAFRREMRRGAG